MESQDSEKNFRDINGKIIADCEENRTCSKCHNHSVYYHRTYDAFFCASCNEWHDGICKDPSCDYCPTRPAKPMPLSELAPAELTEFPVL